MALSILSSICVIVICFSVGAFASFVINNLREINNKASNISKSRWSMGVYMMNDIPQTEQNTPRLGSVPVKIYGRGEYSDTPVPRKGEEILGVYYSGKNRFEMRGIVNTVVYNTDLDWIVVECNCIDIRKCKIV